MLNIQCYTVPIKVQHLPNIFPTIIGSASNKFSPYLIQHSFFKWLDLQTIRYDCQISTKHIRDQQRKPKILVESVQYVFLSYFSTIVISCLSRLIIFHKVHPLFIWSSLASLRKFLSTNVNTQNQKKISRFSTFFCVAYHIHDDQFTSTYRFSVLLSDLFSLYNKKIKKKK